MTITIRPGRTAATRNGTRAKTVFTDTGPVEMTLPRDRDGSFEPKIVKKRLTGVDEMVISLSAKGLTTGEVQARLAVRDGVNHLSPAPPPASRQTANSA